MFLPTFDVARLGELARGAAAPLGVGQAHAHESPNRSAPRAWWEAPLAIGLALAVLPPLGVTLLWASRGVPNRGKVAATLVTALCAALAATLVLVMR